MRGRQGEPMKILEDVSLSNYTTFRLGGTAKKMFVPENEEELVSLSTEYSPRYYIGGGSNLLIDDGEYDVVVSLRAFNTKLQDDGDGCFTVGASVRLQELIKTVNSKGYGGIEYLFSVPGLVGGAVAMNAGRGRSYHQCISDYIQEVKVLRNQEVIWIKKDECGFRYRDSVFKNSNDLVLEIKMKFDSIPVEEAEKARKERIALCKRVQDNSKPNFGSVFSESNNSIMNLMRKLVFGKKGGVMYSPKTKNWLLNDNGSFDEALGLIKRAELFHKIAHKPCKREIVVWSADKH